MEVIEYAWNVVSTVQSLTLSASDFVYLFCLIPYKPSFTIWTIFISVTGYTISLQSTPETNLPLLYDFTCMFILWPLLKLAKFIKCLLLIIYGELINIRRVITENKLQ